MPCQSEVDGVRVATQSAEGPWRLHVSANKDWSQDIIRACEQWRSPAAEKPGLHVHSFPEMVTDLSSSAQKDL